MSLVTCGVAPLSRLNAKGAHPQSGSAAYGAFVANEGAPTDTAAFGISILEAQSMDPQMTLLMEGSYAALRGAYDDEITSARSLRTCLSNQPLGFFLGMGGSIVDAREGVGGSGEQPSTQKV